MTEEKLASTHPGVEEKSGAPKPVYEPPAVKSAPIYERLCLRCLKRPNTSCIEPNVRS